MVVAGPIWLGDNSSQTKKLIERLYAHSGELNEKGQWAFYPKVGGCLITGNEDGIKHCSMNVLYSLQHIGFTIPPQADAGWIGPVGPGPSYLDEGSGGPESDFTNRNTTFMTWNLLHHGPDAQGRRRHSRLRQPSGRMESRHTSSISKTRNTAELIRKPRTAGTGPGFRPTGIPAKPRTFPSYDYQEPPVVAPWRRRSGRRRRRRRVPLR